MSTKETPSKTNHSIARRGLNVLWNAGCIASIVGIWPRFIEPRLLSITSLNLDIPKLPAVWEGLRVVQFSDLHINRQVPDHFLKKVSQRISDLSPDMIVFTGDFLCYSTLYEAERLTAFLNTLNAPLGCFSIYGNHDYASYIAVNKQGDYDIVEQAPLEVLKGLRRICCRKEITGEVCEDFPDLHPHDSLAKLLKQTPFTALENETIQVHRGKDSLNICGLGEYMANRLCPDKAYQNYVEGAPGIILVHNPDAIPHLAKRPGDLLLCGHVHGGQVNLPWIRERFVSMENPQYIKGLFHVDDRWVYINRGLGGTLRFRCLASPEITSFTLRGVDG